MAVSELPKPLRAVFPDDGLVVEGKFEVNGGQRLTAHEDGTLRVWRIGVIQPGEDEASFYPIQAVGMTEDEVERSVAVAKQLLDMPLNRAARRAGRGH